MIFQVQPETLQGHFLSIALPIITAFVGRELLAWRRDQRNEKKKKGDKDKQDNELAVLLKNYRLHDHTEQSGPLKVEGIRYPRTNGAT